MTTPRALGFAVAAALGAAILATSVPAHAHGPGWGYGGGWSGQHGWDSGHGWRHRPGWDYTPGWNAPRCRERVRWVDTPWGWQPRHVRVCW